MMQSQLIAALFSMTCATSDPPPRNQEMLIAEVDTDSANGHQSHCVGPSNCILQRYVALDIT